MSKDTRSIVIQWGSAVPGRESIGIELFLSVTQYYQGLVNDSKLSNFQTVLFEQGNLADTSGLFILTGTEDQINTVVNSEKHRENLTKGAHIVNNLRANFGPTNEDVPLRVQQLVKWRSELGL